MYYNFHKIKQKKSHLLIYTDHLHIYNKSMSLQQLENLSDTKSDTRRLHYQQM